MRLLQVLVLSAVLSVVLLPSIVGRHDSTRAAAKAVAAAQVDVQATAPAEPVGLVMVGEGCGWWSNGGGQTQTENSATQIAMCVFEQLLQGVTQPAPIGQACGNITLSQVLAALDSILAYYQHSPPRVAPGWCAEREAAGPGRRDLPEHRRPHAGHVRSHGDRRQDGRGPEALRPLAPRCSTRMAGGPTRMGHGRQQGRPLPTPPPGRSRPTRSARSQRSRGAGSSPRAARRRQYP